MESARLFLVKQLNELMKAKDWSVLDLHRATLMSRSWLTDLIKGETNFGIDDYEKLLLKGFGKRFDYVLSAPELGDIPVEGRDLYRKLQVAVKNAIDTGTLDGLRFAMTALTYKTIADKALQEKTRGSPSQSQGREKDLKEGNGPGRSKRPK